MVAIKGVSPVLFAVTCVALGGCQSYSITPKADQTLTYVQTELSMGKDAVKTATGSLKTLRDAKAADLPTAISQYKEAITKLEEKAGGVGIVIQTADASATKVFAKWEKELADSADADKSDSDASRKAEVTARYNDANGKIVALRGDFLPFMLKLKEVGSGVTKDASVGGRDAAMPAIKDALDQEKTVLRDIDELDRALNKLRGK